MVNGASPGPAPACQQLAAHPVQLADMAPPEAAQECPQGGERLDHPPENTGRPTGAERIGVVDAVAARQHGGDRRHQLVPRVRPPRRAAEVDVPVDQVPQAQVLGEGGRRIRPALSTKRGASKTIWIRLGLFYVSIYCVLLVSGWFSCQKPLSQIQRSTPWLRQGLSSRLSFGGFG